MNYPIYSGNYLAIVLQNNDPEKRGRVKIFVPHISPTVYKNWDEVKTDKKFKFVGLNVNSDLTPVLDELKRILPWAECASPITGEDSSGRYNHYKRTGSVSDSSNFSTFTSSATSSSINIDLLTKYSQNLDAIGEKLGNKYDIDFFRVNDAFNNPAETNVNNVNKYSYNYIPETYSNKAKGTFSVPNVGAHVWVFFDAGDPLKPVYFAASHGQEDWKSIYDLNDSNGIDYPSDFENRPLSGDKEYNINTETYRNKFVLNQKGGTLQIVNTDNREMLKFTHFSGSFKEFNNFTNIELATNNDQKLVIGDQFTTVRGDENHFVGRDSDQIIVGTSYLKIGNLNHDVVKQWKVIVDEISDVKQLFDIRRAQATTRDLFKLTSTKQTRVGNFAPCPVCKGNKNRYYKINNPTATASLAINTSEGGGPYTLDSVDMVGLQDPAEYGTFTSSGKIFGEACPSCGGSGVSTSSMNGSWSVDPNKNNLNALISSKILKLSELEKKMGLGGSQIIDITKHKFETIGLVMNDAGSVRVDVVGKMYNAEVLIHKEGVFENQAPTPLIEYVQVDDLPGGNYTLNVCNKYNVQVGAGGLYLKSYGPVHISGSITNIAGEQVNISSENEVNINGGNRLSLVADVISIRQKDKKQVLIDSSLGVSRNAIIGGGLHVEGELTVNHITAPTEIQQTEDTSVYGTTAKLPTGQGKVIGYAASVPGRIVGYILPGITYSVIIGGDSDTISFVTPVPVFGSGVALLGPPGSKFLAPIEVYGTDAADDCFVAAPHSHNFKNIPLTLTKDNDEMRERGSLNNEVSRNPADAVNNAKK